MDDGNRTRKASLEATTKRVSDEQAFVLVVVRVSASDRIDFIARLRQAFRYAGTRCVIIAT